MRSAGFTLLETVVALALFAIAGMALYGLLSTNLITLARAQEIMREAPVARQAMERLAVVNPMAEAEGAFALDDGVDVVWKASLVEPARNAQTAFGIPAPFRVGLYEIELELRREGRGVGVWRLRQVGYEDLRGPRPGAG